MKKLLKKIAVSIAWRVFQLTVGFVTMCVVVELSIRLHLPDGPILPTVVMFGLGLVAMYQATKYASRAIERYSARRDRRSRQSPVRRTGDGA